MKAFLTRIILSIVFLCVVLNANAQNRTVSEYQRSKQFSMALTFHGFPTNSDINTVVNEGKVLPNWSSKCVKSKTKGCPTRSFSEYAEQLIFQFSYDSIKHFNFRYPTIKTTNGRAKAEIVDYSHDLDDMSGEIVITHNCGLSNNNAKEISVIDLFFPLTTEEILEIGWTKQCGYGDHRNMDYGVVFRERGIRVAESSLKERSKHDHDLVFSPAVLSTRVYLKHKEDRYSQKFSSPVVQVSSVKREDGSKGRKNGLTVDVKGSGFGHIVLGRTPAVFDVFYNCHERGLWKVGVTVNIIPFNAIQMNWMKDCGGGIEKRINIGTKNEEGLADVVSEGIPREGFGSRSKGNEKDIVTGKGSGTKAFFLWTTKSNDSVGSISIGDISAHSYNDRTGKAEIARLDRIYDRARWGIAGIADHGETIDGAVKRLVGVKVECKRKGRVKIGVRVSVHDRKEIEWWFYNDCEKQVGKKKRLFLTAGTMTYVTMTLVCGMMVATVRGGTGRMTTKFPQL